MTALECGAACVSRRTAIGAGAAGAVILVAGCQTYGGSQATGGDAHSAGAPVTIAQVGDIPVGGGKIFTAQHVVITQPDQGTIKAFSSTCTHQGCTVTTVASGTINCPCHGSKFSVKDGSVTAGPAPAPLPAVKVTVAGTAITLA